MTNVSRRITLKKNYILALFAGLLFLSFVFVNIGSGLLLGRQKLDLTGDGRYTLSEASRRIVSEINSPLYIRFYLSSAVSREYPALYQYSQAVLRRLETYRDQNPEMIRIEIKDPEPYGKIAEEAQKQGLKSFLSADGRSELYFGAVLGNDNGDSRIIEQFSPGRAGYLENDISRAIAVLNNPLRPKIGITSDSLPVSEKHYGGRRHEWAFLRLLRSEYDVVGISPQTAEIPYDVETLILINPHRLSPLFAYALDQYLLRGGRIILFADVYSETEAEIYGTASENSGQINSLLKNWGVSVNFAKVIGDRSLGENLVSGSESGEKLSNLPTWLNLNGSAINTRLPFTENIVSVRLRSAGSIDLHQVENVKASPLFATTEKGGRIDAETVRLHNRQTVSEQFAEEGKRFLAAVLLEGKADSASLRNPLDGTGFEKEMLPFLPTSIKDGKLLVVADSDMLADSLWVNGQAGGNEGVYDLVPYAQNGEFILRAVDYMTGAETNAALGSKSLNPERKSISAEIYQQKLQPYLAEYEQNKRLLGEKEKFAEIWNEAVQNDDAGVNMAVIRKQEQNRKEIRELQKKLKQTEYLVRKETTAWINTIIWLNMALIPGCVLFIVWLFRFFAVRRQRRMVREVINEYKIS